MKKLLLMSLLCMSMSPLVARPKKAKQQKVQEEADGIADSVAKSAQEKKGEEAVARAAAHCKFSAQNACRKTAINEREKTKQPFFVEDTVAAKSSKK